MTATYEQVLREVEERLSKTSIDYLRGGGSDSAAAFVAMVAEFTRIEIRMRALARAALLASNPFLGGADTLQAIAHGVELP